MSLETGGNLHVQAGTTPRQPLTGTVTLEHGPVEKHLPGQILTNISLFGMGKAGLSESIIRKNGPQRLHRHAQASLAGF